MWILATTGEQMIITNITTQDKRWLMLRWRSCSGVDLTRRPTLWTDNVMAQSSVRIMRLTVHGNHVTYDAEYVGILNSSLQRNCRSLGLRFYFLKNMQVHTLGLNSV